MEILKPVQSQLFVRPTHGEIIAELNNKTTVLTVGWNVRCAVALVATEANKGRDLVPNA